MDALIRQMLEDYIDKNLNGTDNPRQFGKALKGTLHKLWRYEVGKYRLICNIEDEVLRILVVKVGHRREVYRN